MQAVLRIAARDGYKTILHVGDLAVLWPGEAKFTYRLKRLLDELDLTFIFVDGNHDVHPKLRALPLNDEGFGVISDRLLYAPAVGRHQYVPRQGRREHGAFFVTRWIVTAFLSPCRMLIPFDWIRALFWGNFATPFCTRVSSTLSFSFRLRYARRSIGWHALAS